MRDAFSKTLVDIAKNDPKVLLLTGDHGYALFDAFRKECPAQYINAGIAEQNMIGMAAGLARAGFRPIVYGLSAFIPVRVLEQIKLDIAHDGLPVILCGDGAGFVYSHLGTSHQSTEDVACTRAIPNLMVMSPADRFEMTSCLRLAYNEKSSVYIRMGKSDRGDVHSVAPDVKVGSIIPIIKNHDSKITLIATGSMVKTAMNISANNYPNSSVWSAPSIKPIEVGEVVEIAKTSKLIFVLEEHSIYGGLGSRIAEICAEYWPARVINIGVQDRFSHNCGTYEYLLKEHGLDEDSITLKIRKIEAKYNSISYS